MADWLHEEMERFEIENGEGSVPNDEWEYARGCEPKVQYLCLCLNQIYMIFFQRLVC